LASIDGGSDIWIALAEQGEGGFVEYQQHIPSIDSLSILC
jgi:hypothetical protein